MAVGDVHRLRLERPSDACDRAGILQNIEPVSDAFLADVGDGFLPCGPVLAVALSAAAAPSAPAGAARMLAYGLGTLPVLVVLGAVATNLSPRIRQAFHRVSGILVLIIALQIVLRGLSTLGVIPPLHLGPVMIY